MRRRQATKRKQEPDIRFSSTVVSRFISTLLKCGKKSLAERIFYNAVEKSAQKLGKAPMEVLDQALGNAKPYLETKSRRVGGATYQVPVEVSGDRQVSLAVRWLVQYASERKGIPMEDALVQEIVDAFNNTGAAIKKRDDTHKMAESNRAFAHYRW
ncbi:MAG: 30S ribosomal protein S7 [Chlamydiae bacterium]|nr:30S ribosomal protein S7 [Chlamydiota bacterium]MBI3277660.1 30S ribosomal protein S7 [Chlamydiota bacterium]